MDRMGVGMGLMDLDQELARADVESVSSDNTVASGTNGNVQVVVRVRPPSSRERDQGYVKCVGVDPAAHSVTLNFRPLPRTFTFDYVSDEIVGQEEIFTAVGKPITDACLQGYHCCLIAYGQTGAGKTFTMEGPDSESSCGGSPGFLAKANLKRHEKRGLIPRILDYIFQKMASEKIQNCKDVEFVVKCSYLQIYNEQVSDLLDPGSFNLTIHEDAKSGMYVEGLQEVVVSTAEATYGVFRRGSENRHVGMTAMNLESSRSHSVFTVVVESQRRNDGGVMNRRTSRFYLVDLAGSERQKHSESAGIRLKEAGSINKSLSALGNVIKALVDISEGKIRHVPYRDSKLTFLLKDALGGNSKCTLIANISPAEKNIDETLSTLKFAQRAKLIHNTAIVNEDMFGNPAVMGEEIRRLRLEIAALRANVGSGGGGDQSPLTGQESQSETARTSRLEHIISQSVKRSLEAERKNETEMHALSVKLGATQAMCERLEKTLQSQKMIIRLRENTIKRIENGRPCLLPDEVVQDLREEIEQLRKQIEHHPDVVRFKMELDLCRGQLDEYEEERKDEELLSQIAQLENLNQTLKIEFQEMVEEKTALSKELEEVKSSRDIGMNQLTTFEEQFFMLREAVEKYRMEAAEALHKQEKAEEKVMECTREQDEVWRRCNLAEAQATEYAQELTALKSQAEKMKVAFGQQTKLQEDIFMELQKVTDELEHSRATVASLQIQLEESNAVTAQKVTLLIKAEDDRAMTSQSLEKMVTACEQLTASMKEKEVTHIDLLRQFNLNSEALEEAKQSRDAAVLTKEALAQALSQLTIEKAQAIEEEKALSSDRLEKLQIELEEEVKLARSMLQTKLIELDDLGKVSHQQAILINEKEKLCKAAEDAAQELRQQMESMTADCLAHKSNILESSARLDAATLQINSLLLDKTALESKIVELQQILASLSAALDDKKEAESKLVEISAMHLEAEKNIEALTAELETLKSVIQESETKVAEMNKCFGTMKQEYDNLVVENRNIQVHLSKSTHDFEVLSHQKSTLDACLSEELLRTAAAETHIKELEETIHKLEGDLAVMEGLKLDLFERIKEIEILEQRASDQKCNARDLVQSNTAQENCSQVKKTVSLDCEESLFTEKIADLEVASSAMQGLKQMLEGENMAFQMTITDLEKDKEIAKTEKASLQDLLHAKELALQISASKLEDLNSRLEAKCEDLQSAEAQILHQLVQIEEARKVHQACEGDYSLQVETARSLQIENEVLMKNISEMEMTIKLMESSNETLMQEKAELQFQLDNSEKSILLQHPTEEVKVVDTSNQVDHLETRSCIDAGRNHIDYEEIKKENMTEIEDVGLKHRYLDEIEENKRPHEQETDARLVAALADVIDLKGHVAGCEIKLDLTLKSQVQAQEQLLGAVSRTKDLEVQVALLTDECAILREAICVENSRNRTLESELHACKLQEAEYSLLKFQLAELGKELESARNELKVGEVELEQKNSECTTLLGRVAGLISEKQLILQEFEELKAAKFLMETQLTSTQTELVDMGSKCKDLDDHLQLLRLDLEKASGAALDNGRKLEIKREEVDLTTKKLNEAELLLSEKYSRVSQLEKTRLELETRVESLVAENASLTGNLHSVEEELFAASRDFEHVRNDIKWQLEVLKVEKNGLGEQLHHKLSDLGRTKLEMESQFRSWSAETIRIRNSMQAMKEECSAAAEELEFLKNDTRRQLKLLIVEKGSLGDQFHEKISHLGSIRLELQLQVRSLFAENLKFMGGVQVMKEEFSAAVGELELLKNDIQRQFGVLKAEKDGLGDLFHNRMSDLGCSRIELELQVRSLLAENLTFVNSLQDMKGEFSAAVAELELLKNDMERQYQILRMEKVALAKQLQDRVCELGNTRLELEVQVSSLVAEILTLIDNIHGLEDEFPAAAREFQGMKVGLEGQFAVLGVEKDNLSEELHHRLSQLEKWRIELKAQVDLLLDERMTLKCSLQTVDEELAVAGKEFIQFKDDIGLELEVLKMEKERLAEEFLTQKDQLTEMGKEVTTLAQNYLLKEDQLEELQTVNMQLSYKIESLNCKIFGLDTQLKNTVTDAEVESSLLQHQLHQRESQLGELTQQNLRFASDLQELRDEVQYNLGEVEYEFQKHVIDTEARMVELKSQKNLVQSEALQVTVRLSAENSKFAAMLSTLEEQVVDLHMKVRTWVGNFNSLESELLALKNDTLKIEGFDARMKQLEMELLAEQKIGSEYKQEILQLQTRLTEQEKKTNPFSFNNSIGISSKIETRPLQGAPQNMTCVDSSSKDFLPRFTAQQRKRITTSSKERPMGKSKMSFPNQNSASSFRALSESHPPSRGSVGQIIRSQSRPRTASLDTVEKSKKKPLSVPHIVVTAPARQPLRPILNVNSEEMNRRSPIVMKSRYNLRRREKFEEVWHSSPEPPRNNKRRRLA